MNKNPKAKQSAAQADQILAHLRQGRTLTSMQALRKFQCFRLGARILDLKKRGHAIESHMIKRNGKRVAQYSLVKP